MKILCYYILINVYVNWSLFVVWITGVYKFLLQAIIAKPELIVASNFSSVIYVKLRPVF